MTNLDLSTKLKLFGKACARAGNALDSESTLHPKTRIEAEQAVKEVLIYWQDLQQNIVKHLETTNG